MRKTFHTAIIIPAYNEARVVGKVLVDLQGEIKKTSGAGETTIVLINDGSSDNTAQVVSKHDGVLVINHLLNSGAGAATRTGMNVAKRLNVDFAVTMDSDGQHSPADVMKLLKLIQKAPVDVIIGSRLLDTKGMPWFRILGNKGLSFITYLVFGVFVKDSQSGLRAYNKRALEGITFHNNRYAFCSEMIWSAHRKGLSVKEVPIKAIYSEYSLAKGQSNWGAFIIIRQIVKQRLLSILHG